MNKQTFRTAFSRLFPGEQLDYDIKIKYSKKFRPYNANVKKIGTQLTYSFSREWKTVNEEIAIGIIQDLMLKIMGRKPKSTTNIELYSNFVKNLHLSAEKTMSDEVLSNIFNEVNAKYFHNTMEAPNLRWGLNSRRRLATYDYHTDTINVSTVFKKAEEDVLAYLIYHEMLHKKLKFDSTSGRSIHHGKKFRELEKNFENQEQMEKKLERYLRSKSKWRLRIF